MIRISLIIFIFLFSGLNAQKPFKKKFLGKYEGEIGAYTINTGAQFIEVSSVYISVTMRKKDLEFTIGRNKIAAPYSWEKKDKKLLVIKFTRSVENTAETLILNKKTKEILREGIYPQPKVILKKVK